MVEVVLPVDACKGSFGRGDFSLGFSAVQLRSRRLCISVCFGCL